MTLIYMGSCRSSLLQAITLLCATRPGSVGSAAVLAALSRLPLAGVLRARKAAVHIAICCGDQLDKATTLGACQTLLAAMGGGLQVLELTVNEALAETLHQWVDFGCLP